MPAFIDLTGQKFGRLTAIKRVENAECGNTKWLCRCECGNLIKTQAGALRTDQTKSCGCFSLSKITVHNLSYHFLYGIWAGMISRCNNKNNQAYKDYGGRGIKVCEKWNITPTKFITWANPLWKEGLQIDRRNNDGNYTPENCRFVTSYVNNHNQRKLRNTNTSGYAGVCFHKLIKKFQVRVSSKILGGRIHIGYFNCKHEAARARNDFIKKHNLPHKIQEIVI